MRVYGRLYEVLTGADRSERFRHLTASDRQAIRDIVAETKPNLPPFWLAGSVGSPDAPDAQ